MSRLLLRYSKVWEGQDPLLVLAVHSASPPAGPGTTRAARAYLLLDARNGSLVYQDDKPEGLNPKGAFFALMRKHAASGGISLIASDEENHAYWLALHTAGPDPTHLLHLSRKPPYTLSLVRRDGVVLVRRSAQGTYTKSKTWDGPALPLGEAEGRRLQDLSSSLLHSGSGAPPSPSAAAPATTPGAAPGTPLSLGQREARDRLARRLKTVRRAREERKKKQTSAADLALSEVHARLLARYLHLVRPGDFALVPPADASEPDTVSIPLDPELSPGHNLDQLFVKIKKLKRAQVHEQDYLSEADRQIAAMDSDLQRLRQAPLSAGEITQILVRHALAPKPAAVRHPRAGAHATVAHQVYRSFYGEGAGSNQLIEIKVGKGAADNDELCRGAKGHDWWLHAVGTTGSHVLIAARQLKGSPPSPKLLRTAAILALHYSERRDDQRGEVYVTRRQHLKKRKGMAAGLWQIDRSETMFVSFTDAELQEIFARQPATPALDAAP